MTGGLRSRERSVTIRRRRLAAGAGVLAVLMILLIVVLLPSGGQTPPPVLGGPGQVTVLAPSRPAAGRGASHAPAFKPAPAVVSLAASLPLERQVAQLFLVTVGGATGSGASTLGSLDWGGVVFGPANFVSDSQLGSLAADVAALARSSGHLTPLIAATQEGGSGTAFPDLPPEAEPVIGASGQAGVARAQALLAGGKLRSLGFNMTIAPLADVDTPGGALSGRLFSSDPSAVARLSAAAVAGYGAAGTISAVGHFPGTGAASADPDQMTATVGGSEATLRARDLIPFEAVAASAPVIVMSNAVYAAFDGITPAGLLRQSVDLLRNDYGFRGVVMSDDLDAALQPTGLDVGSAALQALRAGDDLLYVTGSSAEQQAAYTAVLTAARKSASTRGLVRDALLRVLSLKVRYGLVRAS